MRVTKILAISVLATAAFGTAACSSIREPRGYVVDNTLLNTVQPGIDNQRSVEMTLGRPTFTSQFGEQGGVRGEIGVLFHPQEHEAEDDGDHVEATFHRVGCPAHAVPVGIASFLDHTVPQRAPLFARIGLRSEKAGEE